MHDYTGMVKQQEVGTFGQRAVFKNRRIGIQPEGNHNNAGNLACCITVRIGKMKDRFVGHTLLTNISTDERRPLEMACLK